MKRKIKINVGIDLEIQEEHYYAIMSILGKKESYTLDEIFLALKQAEMQKN